MTIEQALIYDLQHNAGIIALIGQRSYLTVMPDEIVYPAICIKKNAGDDGNIQRVSNCNITFFIYGENLETIRPISCLIINRYRMLSGDIGETGKELRLIKSYIVSDEQESFLSEENLSLIQIDINFKFWRI